MSKTFDEKLERLGGLIAQASGLTRGGDVLLYCFAGTEELATKVRRKCYELGAGNVFQTVVDPVSKLSFAPLADRYSVAMAEKLAWELICKVPGGAVIQLRTEIDADQFSDDTSFQHWYDLAWQARGSFRDDGVRRGLVPWTLFYVPTIHVARQMFPDMVDRDFSDQTILDEAWRAVFQATGADREDALEYWHAGIRVLHERCRKLNEIAIKELHFYGPKIDLSVGLSRKAQWLGGGKALPDGTQFHVPNVPTYEVYTTPDWRTVTGHARLTRPINVDGVLVEDAYLTFKDGRVVEVVAEHGQEHMRELIARDNGAAQLGEIALVGVGSPIASMEQSFYSIIYDENAACHMALGSAYKTAIEGGRNMSEAELAAVGCNESNEHHDLMISDQDTVVTALTYDDELVSLMEGGEWTSQFL